MPGILFRAGSGTKGHFCILQLIMRHLWQTQKWSCRAALLSGCQACDGVEMAGVC